MSQVCMTPITNAKAWRGETLARETSWIVTLTDAELADIDRAVAAAKASGLPLEQIQREHFPLTVMRARLEQAVTEMYDGRGFVVLRGLPVHRYRDDDVGLIFWGFGRYMGAPLYQNPQGDLLGHVYDHGRTYGNIDVRGYDSVRVLVEKPDGTELKVFRDIGFDPLDGTVYAVCEAPLARISALQTHLRSHVIGTRAGQGAGGPQAGPRRPAGASAAAGGGGAPGPGGVPCRPQAHQGEQGRPPGAQGARARRLGRAPRQPPR